MLWKMMYFGENTLHIFYNLKKSHSSWLNWGGTI